MRSKSNFRGVGAESFVDFVEDTILYMDMETDETIKFEVFEGCLPSSGYGFAVTVSIQNVGPAVCLGMLPLVHR